jgi:hypothetical protein
VGAREALTGGLEADRLTAVRALGMAKRKDAPRFAAVASLLRAAFGVPLALVVLIEEGQALAFPENEGDDWIVDE